MLNIDLACLDIMIVVAVCCLLLLYVVVVSSLFVVVASSVVHRVFKLHVQIFWACMFKISVMCFSSLCTQTYAVNVDDCLQSLLANLYNQTSTLESRLAVLQQPSTVPMHGGLPPAIHAVITNAVNAQV